MKKTTDNYRKHTTQSPIQKFFLNRFTDTLTKEVKKLRPESVLDVGCGEGFVLQKLKMNKVGKRLEGVDFLKTAIDIGHKIHPDVTLKQGNIYDLQYKDNSFDVVICSEVLEHLEDPEKALSELVRVSKKYVVLSVPNEPFFMLGNFVRGKNWSRFGNDIEHIQHWTHGAFKRFVGKKVKIKVAKKPIPWTFLVGRK
jgi:ubiquinone/menaquinone biosynthesis C-methylase UbiE